MKAEGAGLAFIENAATLTNQIKAIGPPCVSRLNAIVKAINQRGKPDAEFAHARTRNRYALDLVLGAAEQHAITHVRLHRPNVSGMRLKNVDRVEADLAAVLRGEFVQGGNLPPKWRSGVTAEDQHHRPVSP